jgi:hypothetical protein
MIQETEDMINLVKSSNYKGDKTEIEICSDYIKDLKKHKLKKIKSMKEKGDKKIKDYVKTKKDDNKISLDEEEDKKDYNEWVDIDDNMNEKGEILIKKNPNISHKDSKLKNNSVKERERMINSLKSGTLDYYANEKHGKQNKKKKNTKISIKESDIDDDIYEKQKMAEALLLSEIDKAMSERNNKILEIEKNAEKLAADSEMYYRKAKSLKRNKFMSWTQYNDNGDFKVENINKAKIICYLSVIFIIIITLVTLLVLFFH